MGEGLGPSLTSQPWRPVLIKVVFVKVQAHQLPLFFREPLLCAVRPPDSSTHSASFAGELHPLVSSPRPGLGSCPSWAWVPQPALCPSCMVPNSAWPDGNTASCSPWPHAGMPTSGFLVAWVCVAVCTN